MRLLGVFSRPALAIDTGTATTRVCSRSSPIFERESHVREQIGPTVMRRSAVRGGVVCDIAAAAQVLSPMIERFTGGWRRPAALICTPSDALQPEREALVEAVSAAGATVVAVIPEPLAAAVGCGIDIGSPYAQLIADIGEGVTDVAAIRNGSVLGSSTMRSGCSDVRNLVRQWLQWHRGILLDDDGADSLVRSFCSQLDRPRFTVQAKVDGRAILHEVGRDDLATLIEPELDSIAHFITTMFRGLPDSAAAEIIETGIALTGGGAALDLLVQRVEQVSGLTVNPARDPLRAVITGAREMLRDGLPEQSARV